MSKNENKRYSTGEATERLGIDKKTLYRFATKGIIPDRRNPVNNYRVYTEEDLKVVEQCLKGEYAN